MQKELEPGQDEGRIQILGVNRAGQEAANASVTDGQDLPWLQETAEVDVWAAWQIAYRDVVIVGPDNRVVEVFNLTRKDLGIAENYAALKDLLLHASAPTSCCS